MGAIKGCTDLPLPSTGYKSCTCAWRTIQDRRSVGKLTHAVGVLEVSSLLRISEFTNSSNHYILLPDLRLLQTGQCVQSRVVHLCRQKPLLSCSLDNGQTLQVPAIHTVNVSLTIIVALQWQVAFRLNQQLVHQHNREQTLNEHQQHALTNNMHVEASIKDGNNMA